MTIKRDYSEPMLKVVYLKGKQSLLVTSSGEASGVNAKMSGYDEDDEKGYGFSQN